jgi:HK97 family phage major capsid protein
MWTGNREHLTTIERQALTEGTDSAGGVLVPASAAASVIDLVRAATVVIAAGATTVPMASDSLTFPRVLTGATPEWKQELAPMTESNLTFGSLVLNAKTLRTKVKLSEELVEDMSPEGSDAITRELTNAFALEIDRVALFGSGVDPEPRGIANWPGVVTVTAVGAPANYDFLAQAVEAIRAANHSPNAYVLDAAAAGALDVLKATDNQPLQPPPSVAGLTPFVTNIVGMSGNGVVGEFRHLIIGARPQLGVRLRTVDASLANDFSVEIVAWQRADIGVVHGPAFCVASGITASAAFEIGEVPEQTETRAEAEPETKAATKATTKTEPQKT